MDMEIEGVIRLGIDKESFKFSEVDIFVFNPFFFLGVLHFLGTKEMLDKPES